METRPTEPFDGKRFLSTVSRAPGVYAMLDREGRYLYVGKAKDLKNRLGSYFHHQGLSPKTAAMMSHVATVRTTVTHTESEALLLENNLIKSENPRYNVVLRDDKSYPYIRLTEGERWPRLCFYRGNRKTPGRYFGPFPSAAAVRGTLAQLQKVFPLRQCEDTFFRNRSRPCLQYQINRCSGPCVGLVDEAAYEDDVRQAVLFLEGRDQTLTDILVRRMEDASAALDFESAARLRDRIAALRRVQERQYVSATGGDVDVLAACVEAGEACVEVMLIRGGRHLGSRHLFPSIPLDYSESDVLRAFVPQHYFGRPVPEEILLSHRISDDKLLESALREQAGRRVLIKHRTRGQRSRWLQMATVNVQDALRRNLAGRASQSRRLVAVQQLLDLDQPPERIECFDISHTQGEKTVASCVVFDGDGPTKAEYRRFNIKGASPGDDYAALSEAVTRRYRKLKEGEGRLPDLVLIDGGKGQLGAALAALEELQVEGIAVVGVAKGKTRKAGMETLFVPGRRRALRVDEGSPALHLIQQIRDEAHRFAVSGHRQQRRRARVTSRLQSISGIGDKRRHNLLKHLGGMRELMRAGVEDLARVPGISPTLAKRIYADLHDE